MAELLGVIASGIAVVSWDQIKDAPAEISFLLREIDCFNLMLSQIQEGYRVPDLVFNNACLDQCLKLCEDGVNELAELVNELEAKIKTKRGRKKKSGGVKVLLKKDELKRFKSRMKQSIRLLSVAYQCHTSAMIQLQPEIIISRVATHIQLANSKKILSDNTVTEDSIPVPVASSSKPQELITRQYGLWISSTTWMKFLLGSFEYKYSSRIQNGGLREEFDAKYRIPCWVSQTVLHCQGYNYLSTWRIKCQAYHYVPYYGPFFAAVRSGDIITVQRMLGNRTAFLTDRCYGKRTCLHVSYVGIVTLEHLDQYSNQRQEALRVGSMEMCSLLLAEGADAMAVDATDSTPFDFLLSKDARIKLVYRTDYQDLELCRQILRTEASHAIQANIWKYRGSISMFRLLLGNIYPPYYQRSTHLRMKFAVNLIAEPGLMNRHNTAALVDFSLSTDGRITTDMANWKSVGCARWAEQTQTMLHFLAAAISYTVGPESESFDIELDAAYLRVLRQSEIYRIRFEQHSRIFRDMHQTWASLIQRFVEAGADIHALDRCKKTPLSRLLWKSFISSGQYFPGQTRLVTWVTVLQSCGVDLQEYGDMERKLGSFDFRNYRYDWKIHGDGFGKRYSQMIISYGPLPSDWLIWYHERSDVYAGDFWDMIELGMQDGEAKQSRYDFEEVLPVDEFHVPGAWMDNGEGW